MSFASFLFAGFFTVVCLLNCMLPSGWRWAFLLFSSYLFYGWWNPVYLVLLILVTLAGYGAGIAIGGCSGRRKKIVLVMALAFCFTNLFACKYAHFFNQGVRHIFGAMWMAVEFPEAPLLLPLGISFYTLQAAGYLIDVYRGTSEPEFRPGHFALFIAFFPQLVAGPIERSSRLIPQFRSDVAIDEGRFSSGMKLVCWGYVKKLVVADRLAAVVNPVFASPEGQGAVHLALAAYLFHIQIFCDFSAYTDIARGAARMLGIDLVENFRRPWLASSLSDFWRRWHISLSSWLKDYLYIPLGGNRSGLCRLVVSLMAVFLFSGLWHRASWTCLAWGGIHGLMVVVERFAGIICNRNSLLRQFPRMPALWGRLGRMLVVTHIVVLGWILFRCPDFRTAMAFFKGLAGPLHFSGVSLTGLEHEGWGILAVGIVVVLIVEIGSEVRAPGGKIPKSSSIADWAGIAACMWSMLLFGWLEPYRFIYFIF